LVGKISEFASLLVATQRDFAGLIAARAEQLAAEAPAAEAPAEEAPAEEAPAADQNKDDIKENGGINKEDTPEQTNE
ncbi:MAG: hypothetical protein CMP50_05700, partial [Flavobacteriales bacterium]|nr:hypothetical protein [Flavobacteriales bacterium]